MTTPGGVPNLPAGGMTLDTMADKLQDMSTPAIKTRAADRVPSTFNGSTGANPHSDITPFGVLAHLFAGFNSAVANADPADIQGPDDLPGLLLAFIESLPVVGQFADVLKAILGEYDGTDAVLNAIQDIFAPIRKLLQLIAGTLTSGFPTPDEITAGWSHVADLVDNFFDQVRDTLTTLLGPLFGGVDFGDLPTPGEVWDGVTQTVMNPGSIPQHLVSGLADVLEVIQDNFRNLIIGMGNVLDDIPFIGDDLEDMLLRLSHIKQKAVKADARSAATVTDLAAGWTGGSSSGDPETAAVFGTAAAIRSAVSEGFILWTFTVSDPAWTVPPELATASEIYLGAIGGGGRGASGQHSVPADGDVLNGGVGGTSGGLLVERVVNTAIGATLNITVGAAAATANTTGGPTSFVDVTSGATLVTSVAGKTGIAMPQGYVESIGGPGDGGRGGNVTWNVSSGSGQFGESSPRGGTGGIPGSGTTGSTNGEGNPGGDGGNGQTSSVPITGGGGGGGGGGRRTTGAVGFSAGGGDGGDGGFPGGGSGGGGAAGTASTAGAHFGGSPGIPGNGLAFILAR